MIALRVLESVHGHLGVLASIALLHPAILMRAGKPLSQRLRLAVILTTGVCATAFATGLVLYVPYRDHVKRPLFAEDRVAGLLFETKEHLAFMVLSLAIGAGVCALVAPREGVGLRRVAAAAYATAAVTGLLVVGLGTYIAGVRGFGG